MLLFDICGQNRKCQERSAVNSGVPREARNVDCCSGRKDEFRSGAPHMAPVFRACTRRSRSLKPGLSPTADPLIGTWCLGFGTSREAGILARYAS